MENVMTFHQFDEGFCVLSKISRINFLYKKGCVVETAQPFAFGQFIADLCRMLILVVGIGSLL